MTPERLAAAELERLRRIAAAMRERHGPEWSGWTALIDVLARAAHNPVIQASKPADDFLQMVLALAVEACKGRIGLPAMLPLDGQMPKGRIGAKRLKQLSEFHDKAVAKRTKYTEADHERWRQLAADDTDLRRLCARSKRECAAKIADREGLPAAAVRTIRKFL